ncbi:hypothetical protein BP00DRAFT_430953 [Aspergillus indologenus CBS 114.80]|uniref:Pentatricopeptide repeat protein n=1 Tax=Aspergillus indologenus CBS 114.80 TaxID=1450541 RepID=A0A2V5HPL6_9EURO|nr:hypothetical protein BP00DRAFT_430953 [Aspergillus indologenus CBS 114.80]
MSFSPHRFLRPRYGAGLPSYALQPRVRPGYWCRQREGLQHTRWHIHDATPTSKQISTEPDPILHESAPPTEPSGLVNRSLDQSRNTAQFSSSSAHTAIPEAESDFFDDTSFPPPKPPQVLDPCDPWSDYKALRTPDYHNEGSRRLRHNALVVNGGTISYRERMVGEDAFHADEEIRKSSFFVGSPRLRRWKVARNELFKAKYFDRPVAREDLVEEFHMHKADKELLAILQSEEFERFREEWEAKDMAIKSEHWMRLSLWLIANSPELALKFLYITCQGEQRPLHVMVCECLLFLRNYPDLLSTWTWEGKTFADILAACLDPEHWPIAYASQKGIRFFVMGADDERVLQAWKLAHERQVYTSAETYLAYAARFTKMKNVDLALAALDHVRQIGQVGLEMTSQPVKSHGCLLLLLDSVEDGPNGRNFRILPKLLEMGMRPDLEMMDLILRNCYRTGDEELGRDMLHHMQSQGYPLTTYTYVTLLSDATRRLDRHEVDRLRDEIDMEGEDIRTNKFVQSKLFHAYFCLNVKNQANRPSDIDNKHAFRTLLKMYNEMYDIVPLKKLGIVPQYYQPPTTERTAVRTSPDAVPLFLMIASYLRCNKHVSVTAHVYERFIELLEKEDPVICSLARTDHTWHEFMHAWRNDVRGLRPSIRLVDTMQRLSNEGSVSPNKPHFRPKPTVYIWTTLISAFLWNKEPRAAEHVIEMMKKSKFKFNQIFWTTLIDGYARNKDILKVAETIRAMENDGFEMDAFCIKALRHIQDPERLWEAVEELDKETDEQVDRTTFESLTKKSRLDEIQDDQGDPDWLLDQGLQRLKAKQA